MGLFDMFSKKETPAKVDKLVKRFLNEHQQQPIRQEALEELASYEIPEAVGGLIKRLGVNFKDTIVNEQEKKWVSNVLVERFGARAVEPLVAFVKSEQTISAVIGVLGRLVSEDHLVGHLVEALQSHAPKDHRTISARLQLVDALSDHEDERVVPALVPYLDDHDDDVRIKVMDTLERRSAHTPDVVVGLVGVLTDPEASGRLTRRAAAVLAHLKADLSDHISAIDDLVPEGFTLQGKHLVQA
ncbi:MAG: HEAT repeat domain-containing protein [Bradymonadia bacterium]